MEKLDIFREAELRFIYRHHRHVLIVQCFQEKFELVKNRIQKLRNQLSSIILPVKSSILSRYYSKSNELQRIAGIEIQLNYFKRGKKVDLSIRYFPFELFRIFILAISSCIITIEQHVDPNRDYLINLKILSRSSQNIDKARQLIKDFEEQKYSIRKIHHNDIQLFTEQDVNLQKNKSNMNHLFYLDKIT